MGNCLGGKAPEPKENNKGKGGKKGDDSSKPENGDGEQPKENGHSKPGDEDSDSEKKPKAKEEKIDPITPGDVEEFYKFGKEIGKYVQQAFPPLHEKKKTHWGRYIARAHGKGLIVPFFWLFFWLFFFLRRGGFSVVYKATERATGKKFAIKRIQKDEEGVDIELLKREIYIMKKVDHPNILKLYEVFEDDDYFFLVLELCVFNFSLSLYFFLSLSALEVSTAC